MNVALLGAESRVAWRSTTHAIAPHYRKRRRSPPSLHMDAVTSCLCVVGAAKFARTHMSQFN